ncbi:MAG: TetR/AcrR family transcriptional regulator [Pseudomonadota bacterium]
MTLFWENGFDATSMNDVAVATGMAKPGLYECFGDKNALYAKALKLYFKEYGEPGLQCIRASNQPVSTALRQYLENVAAGAGDPECPSGCFIVNSIIGSAQSDSEIKDLIRDIINQRLDVLIEYLSVAKEKGELTAETDPEALALYFAGQEAAIAVLAREGAEPEKLGKFIDIAMKTLPQVSAEELAAGQG